MSAEFRSVQTRMWREDEWFQNLDTDARLLFIYLFTNPSASISGIYRLPLRTIAFESGLSAERVKQLLEQFSKDNKAHYEDGVVWVVRMRENQLPGRISPQVQARLDRDIASIPDCDLKTRYLIAYGYPINTLSIPTPTGADTLSIPTPTDDDTVSILRATETETDTETIQIQKQKQHACGADGDGALATPAEERSAVYACWGDNMPGTLTPLIADAINDDIQTYGADEVIRAIGIAVSANKRNLQYVQGILRRRAAGDQPPGSANKQMVKQPAKPVDVTSTLSADLTRALLQ